MLCYNSSNNEYRKEVSSMIMCSNCHKRPAVVFLSPTGDIKESRGLCLVCAKQLGIKPVNDLLDKMGITDDQMEAMESELNAMMNAEQDDDSPDGNEPDENALNGFIPGGAATMPFLQNIFPSEEKAPEQVQNGEKKAPKEKHKTAHCLRQCGWQALPQRPSFRRPARRSGTGCFSSCGRESG